MRPNGARHGKTEAQKEHFIAHNARRRCIKKNFEGIHDRFQRDLTYRDSQLKSGWTEEKCIEMDKLAQANQSYCPLSEEYERYKKNWYISLNTSGRNAPMKLRSDFREAFINMHRLHRESGEERPEPIFFNTKGGIRLLLPVPHGGSGMKTGGVHKLKIINDLWAHTMSGLKEQWDLFWTLTHLDTQSEFFLTIFFNCCSQIVYSC